MSTALTQLYYHTMARPRVVSEKESLLEGESGPTPAEKTLPTPCQQDRSWPSLEDGNGDLCYGGKFLRKIMICAGADDRNCSVRRWISVRLLHFRT